MRVRDWQDLLSDVVDAEAAAGEWRAVAGSRSGGIGEDLYLGHPAVGLYQLKTYAKNPFEVKGVGARIARHLDDEIAGHLPEQARGRFAIQQPPRNKSDAETKARRLEEIVNAHADAPTSPADFFGDVMSALEAPAYGPVDYDARNRPDRLGDLAATFEEPDSILDTELDELIDEDGIDRGFG